MAEPNSPQPLTGHLAHSLATHPSHPARPTRPSRPSRPLRPLPDAVAIQPIDVPLAEPPYDLVDDTATLDALEPVLVAGPEPFDGAHFAQRYSAGPWPSQFAQALAETLAGTRPRSQIVPWTSVTARRKISQLSPVMATSSQPKLKRVIITSPAGGVLEMTVVVDLGHRVRALAVRLELTDSASPPSPDPARPVRTEPSQPAALADPRWRCTAIEAA